MLKIIFHFLIIIIVISGCKKKEGESVADQPLVDSQVKSGKKIVFYLEDELIYTTSSQENPGFLLEIVLEMVKVLKIDYSIKFLPWKRAQIETQITPNAIIFPLTRTEEREPYYQWICKILDVPVMFINKKGQKLINTVDEAKKLDRIGVITGTPQENQLINFGLKNYSQIEGKYLYQILSNNQVDAIYTAWPEAFYGWKQGGYPGKLQHGRIFQSLPLWIACNQDSDLIKKSDWIEAFNKVKESGFFSATFNKYFSE
ncbi:MAG: ABC transporter substrate-binding protein [Spirochaetes bacterium]|nr:ABC transporter substrate-binding protein [Spirochaetota bacterium]